MGKVRGLNREINHCRKAVIWNMRLIRNTAILGKQNVTALMKRHIACILGLNDVDSTSAFALSFDLYSWRWASNFLFFFVTKKAFCAWSVMQNV